MEGTPGADLLVVEAAALLRKAHAERDAARARLMAIRATIPDDPDEGVSLAQVREIERAMAEYRTCVERVAAASDLFAQHGGSEAADGRLLLPDVLEAATSEPPKATRPYPAPRPAELLRWRELQRRLFVPGDTDDPIKEHA